MWDRAVDGRILRFHLMGLNHHNFIMADEETGSWWQQITGECLLGPLKGKHLRRISSDEVTLATWRDEQPRSTVVKFDPRYLARYPDSDWEKLAGFRPPRADGPLASRELVVGVELNGAAAAWPLAALRKQSPVNTKIGGAPVLLVVDKDGNSARSFLRTVDGRVLEFYRRPEDGLLIDSVTGSSWSFGGVATSGALSGRRLEAVQNTKDYWFDWKRHHPAGVVFSLR